MATPTILWTALPNGTIAGGAVRLSIFVSPRFTDPTAATLGDYTLGNWPSKVLSLGQGQLLRARFGPLATGPSFPLAVNVADLNPALWDALFPSTARVRPFQFRDHSTRPLRSFSVRAIQRYIEDVYTAVANASPTDFPDLNGNSQAATLVNVLTTVMDRVRQVAPTAGGPRFIPPLPPGLSQAPAGPHPDAALEAQLDALVPMGSGVPASEFYRAYRFYNRGQQEAYRSQFAPRVVSDIPAPLERPSIDVHEVMAALGDHPAILRRLGLVLDCVLTGVDVATLSAYSQIKIDVLLPSGGPSPNDQSPWTAYDPARFLPRSSAGSDLSRGYLTLGNAQLFDVFQSDADGNALRTLDYAVSMARLIAARKEEKGTIDCATGLPGPSPGSLPQPQSLPALRGTGFTISRDARDRAVSQQFASAKTHNALPADAVLYHENVVRGYRVDVQYHGRWFSLCQRVPGYAIGSIRITPGQDEGFVSAGSGTSAVKDPPSGPPAEKDLYLHEALFGWHNWSLVVARPGRSISFDRNDADRTQTVAVRRETSPVDPDFPLQIAARVPDRTLPPLRFGQSYRFRARAVDLAGNGPALSETVDPGQAFSAAATFVRYEPAAGPVLVLRAPITAGESVEHLVIRSKVTADAVPNESAIFNATCERHVAPPKTSQQMAEQHGAFDALVATPSAAYAVAIREQGSFQDPGGDIKLIDASGAEVDPSPLNQKGAPLPDGYYVIHTSAQPPLPYLPDPVVTGAAFKVPGNPLVTKSYAVSGGWPDLATFRLVLAAAAGQTPTLDAGDPFTVRLPRGTMLTVRYSSTIAESKLPLFARYNALNAAARADFAAAGNQHWMLTPYRELTFVHAVEKPLAEPTVDADFGVSRKLGETFVTLRGTIHNHSNSTGEVELFGNWNEMLDLTSLPGPGPEARSGRVFDRKVDYDEAAAAFPNPRTCEPVRHEFGDTKHRWVKYRAVATTRYREYFPTLAADPALLSREGPETGLVNVPNAARPVPPKILYILPIFKWETSDDGKSSTRRGRALRVYVERPWYASGDDELLGVIVPPAGNVPDELAKYISQWGSDPIWSGLEPSVELAPDHFIQDTDDPKSAVTVLQNLSLSEVDPNRGDLLVSAVGIQPQYNADRKLHYFDLELDPGTAYFPFVRLVLARFQPHSLDGAHLSSVVRTEFAQLVADRTASIAYNGVTSVDVTVSGVVAKNQAGAKVHAQVKNERGVFNEMDGYLADPGAGEGRLVLAHVERRQSPSLGELGWEAVGKSVVLASFTMIPTPGSAYFRGNVPLPATLADGAAYRLVVRELEVYETDLLVYETGLPLDNPNNVPVRSRLVYVDMLPLSAS